MKKVFLSVPAMAKSLQKNQKRLQKLNVENRPAAIRINAVVAAVIKPPAHQCQDVKQVNQFSW